MVRSSPSRVPPVLSSSCFCWSESYTWLPPQPSISLVSAPAHFTSPPPLGLLELGASTFAVLQVVRVHKHHAI